MQIKSNGVWIKQKDQQWTGKIEATVEMLRVKQAVPGESRHIQAHSPPSGAEYPPRPIWRTVTSLRSLFHFPLINTLLQETSQISHTNPYLQSWLTDSHPSKNSPKVSCLHLVQLIAKFLIQHAYTGQTEPMEKSGAGDADDFLARERAVLGEDADEFATPQDNVATAEGADNDDLLGGGDLPTPQAAPEEISGFESSFPAIDTQNEVWMSLYSIPNATVN